MILLLAITGICFLTAFIHYLTKPVSSNQTFLFIPPLTPISFQIVKFLSGPSREEKQLTDEITDLKAELADISMRTEYTNYVKCERKVVTLQKRLNDMRNSKQSNNLLFKYGVPYGSQALLTFGLFVMSLYYRNIPVFVFDDQKFDLVPFAGLIRFPTGVDGAISVPFWIFVNSFVLKHAASYVWISVGVFESGKKHLTLAPLQVNYFHCSILAQVMK